MALLAPLLPSVLFEEFVCGFQGSELEFEQVPFNHPLFVMYSSGTTGTPKCMVHSVGVSCVVLCVCVCDPLIHLLFLTGHFDSTSEGTYSPWQHE